MQSVYTAQLSVTASAVVEAAGIVHTQFVQGVDRAWGAIIAASESRPAVATYRALTSSTAKAVYRFVGRLILAIGAAAMYGAFFAGVSARRWCDALVDSCLELPIEPAPKSDSVTDLPDPWEVVEVEPAQLTPVAPVAPVAAPVLLLAPAAEAPVARLNAYQLRNLCSDVNIRWRNANGKGKHLSVSQMRQQLVAKGVMVA